MRLLVTMCVFTFCPLLLHGQAMVEAAVLSGVSATGAAAKGKTIGDSMKKILGKVDANLKEAASTPTASAPGPAARSASSAVRAGARPAEPPRPKPAFTDFTGIEPGVAREDLVAKLGPPSFAISMTEDGRLVETMKFTMREGPSAKVKLADGKVVSLELPPQPAAAQTP